MKPVIISLITLAAFQTPTLAADDWTNLGGGSAGSAGQPTLSGTGILESGQMVSLNLTQAKPSAATLLFVSSTSSPVMLGAGVLHAFPTSGQPMFFGFATDGNGAIPIATIVPPGLPLNVPFYFQYAIQDSAGAAGVALSNGLRALTPSVAPSISAFSPPSGGAGTMLQVDGGFLGSDPDDICMLLMNNTGEVVGFTDVAQASENSLVAELINVVPNSTTGTLAILTGNGSTSPAAAPAGFTAPVPAWTFFGTGSATLAAMPFVFATPNPLPGGIVCKTIHGTHLVSDHVYQVTLPFKLTDMCQPGTKVTIDFHANFNDTDSIHLDARCDVFVGAAGKSAFDCANAIAKCYNDALNAHVNQLWVPSPPFFQPKYDVDCQVGFNSANGELYIYFNEIPGGLSGGNPYTSVSFYVTVCQ